MTKKVYVPESCVWELTLKCNLRCLHCGSTAGKARENELTLEESLNVADQLVELDCKKVSLIGGEVFLYHGWEEVAKKLTDQGVIVNIITNGLTLGDQQIKQIQYANLVNVAISVDGMEDSHNKIRGTKNAFQKILTAFERLHQENIPIAVVTTLTDFSFPELEQMYALFVEQGIKVWQIQIAHPMGNMKQQQNFLLQPEKIPLITQFIREKRYEHEIRIYTGDNIGYYDKNDKYIRGLPGSITHWKGCQAGLIAVGIDSVGNIKGCQSIYSDEFIEGNIREESLRDIWYKEGNFAYNRNFDINQLTGNCANCDKGAICRGGCRASCFFNKGAYYENTYCLYNRKSKQIKTDTNCQNYQTAIQSS
jgi:radical SAM protein with 4Fe4S-binding SPASM domain